MKDWYCPACGGRFDLKEMDGDDYGPICPDCGNLMPVKIKEYL